MQKNLRRLWNNLASIRDYEVEECIKNNESIVVTVDNTNGKMTLSPEMLKRGFSALPSKIRSKYNAIQTYQLIDFRWKPDGEDEKQQKLF